MKRPSLSPFDLMLPAAVLLLVAVGVLFIYSAGLDTGSARSSGAWIRQLVWAATGVALMLFLTFFNLATLRTYALGIYAGNLLLIVVTLLFGREVNGARAWLGIGELGVQPSEFMKITTILFLGVYFTGIGNGIRELPRFLLGLLIILVPMGLVMLQPDLGTALVFIPIFLGMAFIAGAEARHLAFLLAAGLAAVMLVAVPVVLTAMQRGGAVLGLIGDPTFLAYVLAAAAAVTGLAVLGWRWTKRRHFYWIAWTGAGWNILQSVTAIGSGGLFGKGWLQGTQSQLQYLPQQSTDFIFSILAEEWGFLGGVFVLGLFLVILLRGLSVVWGSREDYSLLTGTGILAMLFFHVLVNIGMAMGIMPITGIPLMLLSYGGSSLWTALAGAGILMNINRRRHRY
ncbi:MAG: rod shape-determining protein RodA [Spirochaetes bacterium]|nr:rod shape-determining protein RodA [Spirochaetota bacterium]